MTGSGTLADPYIIWDVNDLQNMELDLTAYYELGQDIDAAVTIGWNMGLGFDPIGDGINPFEGNFDGKLYSISGLYINRIAEDRIGMFGTTRGAHIHRVSLSSCNITGRDRVGALIGQIWGDPSPCTVDNCSSTGSVAGVDSVGALLGLIYESTINRCYSSCTVTATGDEVGGLIGEIIGGDNCTISKCYCTGNIVAGHWYVGGFTGSMEAAIISECYSTGSVTGNSSLGGFIGLIDGSGTISDCYSTGSVTAARYGGGFVDYNDGGTITNCYSTGSVTAPSGLGGFCEDNGGTITGCYWDTEASGQTSSDGGTGKTTEEMNHRDIYIAAGWDLDTIWNISQVTTGLSTNITLASAVLNGLLNLTIINEAYPFLRWQTVVELPCDCGFEWGETVAFGNFTPIDSKNTGESFTKALAGLKYNTKYYFRALASSSPGPIHGGIGTFTTLVAPQLEVETLPATNITENSARIWGVVRKVPITAMGRFDWGGNIEYGVQTPWEPGLVSDDMFYFDLANLAEGRAYHFRAVAMGSSLVYGNDMTFTTRSPLGPVTLIQEELAHIMEVS